MVLALIAAVGASFVLGYPGTALSQARSSATPSSLRVQPALDGIFGAFQTNPVVGIGSYHGVAQEQALWIEIIRDPRFAGVRNVVLESASSAHQDIIDRYVSGGAVSSSELNKVWLDGLVACCLPGTMVDMGGPYLLAAAREVNSRLPVARHIKVWAGEPPAGWRAPEGEKLPERNAYPAQIIVSLLDQGQKALVIYGGAHFREPFSADDRLSLDGIVARRHPAAFRVFMTYTGMASVDCTRRFEASKTDWPIPAVLGPVPDDVAAELTAATCRPYPGRLLPSPELSAAQIGARLAAFERMVDDGWREGLLYLGPAASLMRSPLLPDAYLNPQYRAELVSRRIPPPNLPPWPVTARPLGIATRHPARPPAPEEARQAAFKANDMNADARLDRPEYRAALDALGFADQFDELWYQRDRNKDGYVSVQEFAGGSAR